MTIRTSDSSVAPRYSIIVPEDTPSRAAEYLKALRVGQSQPGALLRDRLQDADLQTMTEQDLLAKLFDTKQPQIFAEMAVAGDGSDWSLTELGLGVKAAATSSMSVFTGVEGEYDPARGKYQPPQPYSSWGEAVEDGMRRRELRLWNPLAVWRSIEAK